jgi:hypothetical protein
MQKHKIRFRFLWGEGEAEGWVAVAALTVIALAALVAVVTTHWPT